MAKEMTNVSRAMQVVEELRGKHIVLCDDAADEIERLIKLLDSEGRRACADYEECVHDTLCGSHGMCMRPKFGGLIK